MSGAPVDRDEDNPADYGYGRESYVSGFRRGHAQDHERDYQYRGGYGGPGGFSDYGRRAEPPPRRSAAEPRRDWRAVPDRDRGWWERFSDNLASWIGNEDAEYARHAEYDRHQRDHGAGHSHAREADHYGRGPRGYKRSDTRIHEDVNDRLSDDRWVDASNIEVAVSGAEVTLNGAVNTRQEKRRAEDIAESVSGVTHVQNNLRVGTPAALTEGADRPGGTVRTDGDPIH
jgi:hypothetical protein